MTRIIIPLSAGQVSLPVTQKGPATNFYRGEEMNKPYLGMYVHMHWSYRHPYAARTWTLDDWRNYTSGLKRLGYNMVMIWPMFETIPDPPTPSDVAHLQKISSVIDMLHDELGMDVIITLGPNTVGNENAANYEFEKRPFFASDLRLNPGDPGDMDRLINFRRKLFQYVGKADGFSIIDSDPGGYIGSTNEELVGIFLRHMNLVKEFNPEGRLYYWMWAGWETYNKMWEGIQNNEPTHLAPKLEDFTDVVGALMQRPDQKWGFFSCWPLHQEAVEKFSAQDRTLFYPYGLVEGEPTTPLTNHHPELIAKEMERYDRNGMRVGAMANSQSHVLQLPNTYYFSHLAQGGKLEDSDLDGFAERLITGLGALIANSWRTMQITDSTRMRELADEIAKAAASHPQAGPLGGLLMNDPQRFLIDLAHMLKFKASIVDVDREAGGDGARAAARSLASAWKAWQQRTGFADLGDTQGLYAALDKLGLQRVKDELALVQHYDPAKFHGVTLRLIAALEAWSA